MPQARTYESSLGIHYFFQSTRSLQCPDFCPHYPQMPDKNMG